MNTTVLDEKGVIQICAGCGQRNRILFTGLASAARCGQCKQELPAIGAPVEIHETAEFEPLLANSSLPVLVDFWADWCGPCKMMVPELQRVATKSARRWLVAKVNTEGLPSLAEQYQIRALPTLVLFHSGREKARSEGVRPAIEIERFIERALQQAA